MSQEKLDLLYDQYADCYSVIFADIDTGVVMISNSLSPHNRSKFSELCSEAAMLLGNKKQNAIFSDVKAVRAYSREKSQVKIYLRNPSIESDVLCCLCAPTIDLDAFIETAEATLADISKLDE